VFEYEEQPPVEPGDDDNVDYTGLKILAVLVPVFLLFIYLGRADMGFAVSVVLGMMMLAIKVNWEKRSHWWFWTTVVLVFALHIPLFLIARVPNTKFPTLGLSFPIGILDLVIISGVLRLAGSMFSKDSSDDQ
jgi:hypothetical protein